MGLEELFDMDKLHANPHLKMGLIAGAIIIVIIIVVTAIF